MKYQSGNIVVLHDYCIKSENHMMENKKGRPYLLIQNNQNNTYWAIPYSSKLKKYNEIYRHYIKKYGRCEKIMPTIFQHKKAYLLFQNMIPVTDENIKAYFVSRNSKIIWANQRIIQKAKNNINRIIFFAKKTPPVRLTYTPILEPIKKRSVIINRPKEDGLHR